MRSKIVVFSIALFVAALTATTALADSITFNTSLNEGVYMGSGISNTDWTTFTSGPFEMGLSVWTSGPSGGPIVSSDGTYSVPTGTIVDLGFSIDTDVALAAGGTTLGGGTDTIIITNDNNNESYSFNPATLLPDNAYLNASGGVVCNGTSDCAYNGAYIGMQNSEKPTFSFIASEIGLNINTPTDLTITEAWNTKTDPQFAIGLDYVGATSAVPEPASFGMIGAGLIGLGVLRRRFAKGGSK